MLAVDNIVTIVISVCLPWLASCDKLSKTVDANKTERSNKAHDIGIDWETWVLMRKAWQKHQPISTSTWFMNDAPRKSRIWITSWATSLSLYLPEIEMRSHLCRYGGGEGAYDLPSILQCSSLFWCGVREIPGSFMKIPTNLLTRLYLKKKNDDMITCISDVWTLTLFKTLSSLIKNLTLSTWHASVISQKI